VDLVQDVVKRLGVDEDKAKKGLGTVFIALRMASDMRTFTQISSAFPDSGEWMMMAPFQDGATGEMLAMATPAAVRRLLAIAGYDKETGQQLSAIVGEALKATVPDAFEVAAAKLPIF
jgi:hypothetical protein